jgi:hypothetical protein
VFLRVGPCSQAVASRRRSTGATSRDLISWNLGRASARSSARNLQRILECDLGLERGGAGFGALALAREVREPGFHEREALDRARAERALDAAFLGLGQLRRVAPAGLALERVRVGDSRALDGAEHRGLERLEARGRGRAPRLGLRDRALVAVEERKLERHAERHLVVALVVIPSGREVHVGVLARDLELELGLGARVVGERRAQVEAVRERQLARVAELGRRRRLRVAGIDPGRPEGLRGSRALCRPAGSGVLARVARPSTAPGSSASSPGASPAARRVRWGDALLRARRRSTSATPRARRRAVPARANLDADAPGRGGSSYCSASGLSAARTRRPRFPAVSNGMSRNQPRIHGWSAPGTNSGSMLSVGFGRAPAVTIAARASSIRARATASSWRCTRPTRVSASKSQRSVPCASPSSGRAKPARSGSSRRRAVNASASGRASTGRASYRCGWQAASAKTLPRTRRFAGIPWRSIDGSGGALS